MSSSGQSPATTIKVRSKQQETKKLSDSKAQEQTTITRKKQRESSGPQDQGDGAPQNENKGAHSRKITSKYTATSKTKKFSLKDIARQIKRRGYRLVKILGKGSYGCVCLGHSLVEPQSPIAVKLCMDVVHCAGELRYWSRLKHPNVIHLCGTLQLDTVTVFLMKYCPNGSVLDFVLRRPEKTTPDLVRRWSRETTLALAYIHSEGLCHLDLHVGNLLLDGSLRLQVADLGFMMTLDLKEHIQQCLADRAEANNHRIRLGCPGFRPPEAIKSALQGKSFPPPPKDEKYFIDLTKVDIWALGACMYFMVTSKQLAGDSSGKIPKGSWTKVATNVDRNLKAIPSVLGEDISILQVMRAALQINPSKRQSAEKLLHYHWLREASAKKELKSPEIETKEPSAAEKEERKPEKETGSVYEARLKLRRSKGQYELYYLKKNSRKSSTEKQKPPLTPKVKKNVCSRHSKRSKIRKGTTAPAARTRNKETADSTVKVIVRTTDKQEKKSNTKQEASKTTAEETKRTATSPQNETRKDMAQHSKSCRHWTYCLNTKTSEKGRCVHRRKPTHDHKVKAAIKKNSGEGVDVKKRNSSLERLDDACKPKQSLPSLSKCHKDDINVEKRNSTPTAQKIFEPFRPCSERAKLPAPSRCCYSTFVEECRIPSRPADKATSKMESPRDASNSPDKHPSLYKSSSRNQSSCISDSYFTCLSEMPSSQLSKIQVNAASRLNPSRTDRIQEPAVASKSRSAFANHVLCGLTPAPDKMSDIVSRRSEPDGKESSGSAENKCSSRFYKCVESTYRASRSKDLLPGLCSSVCASKMLKNQLQPKQSQARFSPRRTSLHRDHSSTKLIFPKEDPNSRFECSVFGTGSELNFTISGESSTVSAWSNRNWKKGASVASSSSGNTATTRQGVHASELGVSRARKRNRTIVPDWDFASSAWTQRCRHAILPCHSYKTPADVSASI